MKLSLMLITATCMILACNKQNGRQHPPTDEQRQTLKGEKPLQLRASVTVSLTFDNNQNKEMLQKALGDRFDAKRKEAIIQSLLATTALLTEERRPAAARLMDDPICEDVTYGFVGCNGYDQMVYVDGPPGTAWDPSRCLFDYVANVNRNPKYKCVSMFTTIGTQVNTYAEGKAVISAGTNLPAYCQCAH